MGVSGQVARSGRYDAQEVEHARVVRDLRVDVEEAVDQQARAADQCRQRLRPRPFAAPALHVGRSAR